MRKHITVLLAAAMLVLSLGACGAAAWQEQYDRGVKYLSEGNYEEAMLAFNAAIDIDPNQAMLYVGRAGAYIGAGETEENLIAALADYARALELDEGDVDAWLGLADVYIRRGEYAQALEVLLQAKDKTGGAAEVLNKLAEVERGVYADADGKLRRRSGYDETGALRWYHILEYSSSGALKKVTSYDEAGVQTSQVEMKSGLDSYHFSEPWGEVGLVHREEDAKGRTVREYHYYAGSDAVFMYIEFLAFDEYGNPAETVSTCYSPDGRAEQTNRSVQTWIGKDKLLERREYDESGALICRYHCEYDEAAGTIRENYYQGEDQLQGYTIYTQDKMGNEIGIESYDEEGNLLYSNGFQEN